jgi:hypothetical protein
MLFRSILTTVAAAALLAALPGTANAAPAATTVVDRSLYDATPEHTEVTLRVDGPTAGPLGGSMDVTVRAADETLPTAFGSCEPVSVRAVVTVAPGKVVTVQTRGEACAHIVDGSLQVNAGFGAKDVAFSGYPRRVRLVGEGFIAVAHTQLGGQASFFTALRG